MAVKLNRSSSIADINVTPLVDVMLVLLVIFMVTAPLLETRNQAVNVDLPQVRGGEGEPGRGRGRHHAGQKPRLVYQ